MVICIINTCFVKYLICSFVFVVLIFMLISTDKTVKLFVLD